MRGAIARAEELLKRNARRGHPAAVPEPRQSRDPPPDHRRGDLERHRRRGRRLRLRRRHRRHDHRRRPGPEGPQARRARSSPSSPPTARSSPAASRARTRSRGSAPASSRAILDTTVYDEVVTVTNDEAFDYARLCARVEGIPVGISSGGGDRGRGQGRPPAGAWRARTSSSSSRPSPSAICRRRCSRAWSRLRPGSESPNGAEFQPRCVATRPRPGIENRRKRNGIDQLVGGDRCRHRDVRQSARSGTRRRSLPNAGVNWPASARSRCGPVSSAAWLPESSAIW